MKILLIVTSLFLANVASANEIVCSSADQSLSYSRQTSNGGAPLDTSIITFNQDTAVSRTRNDNYIAFSLVDRVELAKSLKGNGTLTVLSGKASGEFTTQEGKEVTFKDQWVICNEETYPVCPQCP